MDCSLLKKNTSHSFFLSGSNRCCCGLWMIFPPFWLCDAVASKYVRLTSTCWLQQKLYSLWSEIVATLRTTSKIFLGEFQNRKKSTQALSVYRKGTVCIYNECLIVGSHKVKIERRGEKKVIVCQTSLSTTWNLVTPPTRRHPLHHQRTRIY